MLDNTPAQNFLIDGQVIPVHRFVDTIDHRIPNMGVLAANDDLVLAATDAMLCLPAKLIKAAVAHEVGHIACKHLYLYREERDIALEVEADLFAMRLVPKKSLVKLLKKVLDIMKRLDEADLAENITEVEYRLKVLCEHFFAATAKKCSQ